MKFILDERFTLNEEDDPNLDNEDDPELDDELTPSGDAESKEIDWEERYNKCKTSQDYEIFWNGGSADPREEAQKGYFEIEWDKNALEVKSLGSSFVNTLIDIGWDKESNPIVAFLKTILEKKVMNIPDKLSMQLIINFYKNKKISANDLKGTGKLGISNLIFNSNLYLTSLTDQEIYLTAQADFIRDYKGDGNLKIAFANIYSKLGNVKNDQGLSQALPSNSLSQLRSAKEVRRLVAKYTGREDEESTEINDSQIAAILNYVKSGGSEVATKALSYAYDVFGVLDATTVEKVNAKPDMALTKAKNAVKVSAQESNDLKKLFKLPQTRYRSANLEALLRGLIEIANS